MTDVENVLVEMERVGEFLRAQVESGIDESKLRAAQARTLKIMIDCIRSVDTSGATLLTRAINGGGWTKSQSQMLAESVNDQVLHNCKGPLAKKVRCQECASFELYLSAKVWAIIDDVETPMVGKIGAIVQAAAAIELLNPNEPTKGRIAKILRYVGNKGEISTKEWYKLKERVGLALLNNQKRDRAFDPIKVYPTDPRELPEAMFESVFAKGAPALRDVAELGACSAGLRKSHGSFKAVGVEETQLLIAPDPSIMNPMVQMMRLLFGQNPAAVQSMLAAAASSASSSGSQEQELQLLRPGTLHRDASPSQSPPPRASPSPKSSPSIDASLAEEPRSAAARPRETAPADSPTKVGRASAAYRTRVRILFLGAFLCLVISQRCGY